MNCTKQLAGMTTIHIRYDESVQRNCDTGKTQFEAFDKWTHVAFLFFEKYWLANLRTIIVFLIGYVTRSFLWIIETCLNYLNSIDHLHWWVLTFQCWDALGMYLWCFDTFCLCNFIIHICTIYIYNIHIYIYISCTLIETTFFQMMEFGLRRNSHNSCVGYSAWCVGSL